MEARTRSRQLRNNPTQPERRLWSALSARKVSGTRFNRQVPIGNYIVDFVARTPGLVVEVDGDTHAHSAGYDDRRTCDIEAMGFRVIRFSNADVIRNLEGVIRAIEEALAAPPSPDPSRKREGR